LQWSSLKIIEDFLKKFGLEYSKSILELFTRTSFKYYISFKRGSRKEIIQALTHTDKIDVNLPDSIENL